jgi:hypothetical protein
MVVAGIRMYACKALRFIAEGFLEDQPAFPDAE